MRSIDKTPLISLPPIINVTFRGRLRKKHDIYGYCMVQKPDFSLQVLTLCINYFPVVVLNSYSSIFEAGHFVGIFKRGK